MYISSKLSFELFKKGAQSGVFGSGTREDPFYGDFDAILALNPGGNLILGPGNFYSAGNLKVKDNTILSGIYQTTTCLKLVDPQINADVYMLFPEGRNIIIKDLMIDMGVGLVPPLNKQKRGGIYAKGDGIILKNILLMNIYGHLPNPSEPQDEECFGLEIAEGTGGLIEGCIVNNIKGNYTSAIYGCNGGTIKNNIVQFEDGYSGFGAGINIGGFKGVEVYNNLIINGHAGIYADWEFTRNALICRNTIKGATRGILFNYQSSQNMNPLTRGGADNISIFDNTIYLPNKDSMGIFLDTTETPYGSWIPNCGFIQDIRIDNNNILSHYLYASGREAIVVATRSNYVTSTSGICGVYCTNNHIEGGLKYRMVGKDKIKGVIAENWNGGKREEIVWS